MKQFVNGLSMLATLTALLTGCSRSDSHSSVIATPKDLVGKKCAVVVGSMMGDMTLKVQPGIDIEWFNDYNSGIEAVRLGRVQAMPLDLFYAQRWAVRNPRDFAITEPYHSIPWGFFFAKGNPLRDRVEVVLEKMRASGDLDRIIKRWVDADEVSSVSLEPLNYRTNFTGKAGVFRVATPGDREPVTFRRTDGIVGFDIDIARRIAYELDMTLELVQISMGAIVPAVQSGKADMGGGGTAITAERAEKVDFSSCYYRIPTVFLINAASAPANRNAAATQAAESGWVASLAESFRRTFIVEDRWKMMARGFGVTVLITLCASLLGTLLAFPIWWARKSSLGWLSWLARSYISLVEGTPVLVLLMVLYYLVFGGVDIDGIWVAVIGFSINSSAYIGETLRSGIDSVPRGQTEAALALGYRQRQAFWRFVLPQAALAVLPVYRGQLINLLKATSVVGYIAISDLNKACDIVRSRTYESFFPILTTAFIYFAAAWAFARLLEALGRRFDPATRRARQQKGKTT